MTNPFAPIYDDLRKPYFSEKKGDGNLANNYPPYDKVTRGDVIAGALGQDQEGGKKKSKVKKESSLDEVFIDKEDGEEKLDVRKGIKNKVEVMPTIKTEQVSGSSVKMKPGSGLGGGVPVYPKGKEPKATGAKLPTLQSAGYEPEGEVIDEQEYTINRVDVRGNTKAYQNAVSGMKNKVTGKPMYKPGTGVTSQFKLADSFDPEFIDDTNKAIKRIMEAMCSKCEEGDEDENEEDEEKNGNKMNKMKKGKKMEKENESEKEQYEESMMTSAEKKKEKKLKDKYDSSGMKSSMKKQYGSERGEQIYFATIRKKAMEGLDPKIAQWVDETCGMKHSKKKSKLDEVTQEVLKKF